ncbi:glutamate-5-semialdehyde dehydrogenase [Pontibacter anaerobius]|uniref:Gamma-glutamyl phosphate reductase n=1 Tax=Pontibacter anaerobius TaxID=2993940 RepID=A0ABT3RIC3_9BACT|nr:glutamate-5-semialdehyde dehydrogenase [Pontibacter anaerobius]MCX2741602.1 glutamate-5-semialdehyde dehydrogenase [Pontibacter anaerobius]
MELQQIFKRVKQASRKLNMLSEDKIKKVLEDLATKAVEATDTILAANQKDLERMETSDPKYDRLKLTPERIASIAADIRNVASLPSPLGKVLSERSLDNGLDMKKVSVPLGVIGIIYEARPNVTFDVFSLCLRSGNALLLKGGSDAKDSNAAIVKLIHEVLGQNGVDKDIVQLLPPNREATHKMLHAVDYVDIIIPRGSQGLINYVRENSKVPVIETGAGIVHTYFDAYADLQRGKDIVVNAKTRRVSVCNALDCLVIHEDRLPDLAEIGKGLAEKGVELFADAPAHAALKDSYPDYMLQQATEEHFGTEFLSLKMSVKTVTGLDEAIEHINTYTSQHSEAIISDKEEHVEHFLKAVDAAAVYANTSTAFTDGAQFGLGAEIGISTQKLHARGPMALDELTSYKWVVKGNGQVRP